MMGSQLIPGDSKQCIALSGKGTRSSSSLNKPSSADGLFSRPASVDNGSLQRFDLPMYPSPAAPIAIFQLYCTIVMKFPDAFFQVQAEKYSRKVFVSGLPLGLEKDEIFQLFFRRFGPLKIEYPDEMRSNFNAPPRRYALLDFEEERSVYKLIYYCWWEGEKPFLHLRYIPKGSQVVTEKKVWVSPWEVADSFYHDWDGHTMECRNVVSVWNVPRSLKASELAEEIARKYGRVVFVAIERDACFEYPTGAAYVVFEKIQSFVDAIFSRFMHLRRGILERTLELKPYILNDQICDICHGLQNNNKPAPFFCLNIHCVKYYCEHCWDTVHSQLEFQSHQPFTESTASWNFSHTNHSPNHN